MGVNGFNIFDDSFAKDIMYIYRVFLQKGFSHEDAINKLLEQFHVSIEVNKPETNYDSIILYLVLASLQVEKGAVNEDIKQKALQIINLGSGLQNLRGLLRMHRKKEYDELKVKLLR